MEKIKMKGLTLSQYRAKKRMDIALDAFKKSSLINKKKIKMRNYEKKN